MNYNKFFSTILFQNESSFKLHSTDVRGNKINPLCANELIFKQSSSAVHQEQISQTGEKHRGQNELEPSFTCSPIKMKTPVKPIEHVSCSSTPRINVRDSFKQRYTSNRILFLSSSVEHSRIQIVTSYQLMISILKLTAVSDLGGENHIDGKCLQSL